MLEMQRPSQQATFGRLPSCEVPLEHLSISRAHAQLTTDGAGNLFITDLGSGGRGLAGQGRLAVLLGRLCGARPALHLSLVLALLPSVPSRRGRCSLRHRRHLRLHHWPSKALHRARPWHSAPPLCAAHGTNVDGAWIKPKVPKQLRVSSVLKFGASTREYRVAKLPQPPAKR